MVAFLGPLPVPQAMPATNTPTTKPKERKKKPKSFQQSIQDMQEQNHMLMEKKLDMHMRNQHERMLREDLKIQLQRQESNTRFALESRRLDLEFKRMEQERKAQRNERNRQREESRIRELALQVELAKLRGIP